MNILWYFVLLFLFLVTFVVNFRLLIFALFLLFRVVYHISIFVSGCFWMERNRNWRIMRLWTSEWDLLQRHRNYQEIFEDLQLTSQLVFSVSNVSEILCFKSCRLRLLHPSEIHRNQQDFHRFSRTPENETIHPQDKKLMALFVFHFSKWFIVSCCCTISNIFPPIILSLDLSYDGLVDLQLFCHTWTSCRLNNGT